MIGLLCRGRMERAHNSAGTSESVGDGYGSFVVLGGDKATVRSLLILTHTHKSVFGLLKNSVLLGLFLSLLSTVSRIYFSLIPSFLLVPLFPSK